MTEPNKWSLPKAGLDIARRKVLPRDGAGSVPNSVHHGHLDAAIEAVAVADQYV